jgi:hypothetical protein
MLSFPDPETGLIIPFPNVQEMGAKSFTEHHQKHVLKKESKMAPSGK